MKTLWMKTIVLLFLGAGTLVHAQNREEVPGDNFSLEGALELFKKSASPEEFERLLNLPESEVNNLDLNGDGDIDYIRVIDRQEANIHTFTMQAVISRNEFQDIAVISLEKLADGRAILQITGDPDVYGMETIIEPTTEVRVNAGTTTARTYINVWDWPCVQYVYGPFYNPWVSPWYWDYRPFWWRPWRPVAYVMYYPRWIGYRSYYSYCDVPRIRYASRIYYPHRATSIVVYNRHRDQISTYRSTRTVYGETRGRDDSRDSRTMRYDNRNRSASGNSRTRSSNEWSGSESSRQRSDMNQGRREETNRSTETNQWRRSTSENNTRTTERNNSSTNRSFGERSSNQNNSRTFEQPRENRSNNSGSGGNRPEVRQESRQSQPRVSPSQPRQSSGGGESKRSSSGSGSGSTGKRGRD